MNVSNRSVPVPRRLAVANLGTQGPNLSIPFGWSAFIWADPANGAASVYMSDTQANSQVVASRAEVLQTQYLEIQVDDLSRLWFSTSAGALGLYYYVEQ